MSSSPGEKLKWLVVVGVTRNGQVFVDPEGIFKIWIKAMEIPL